VTHAELFLQMLGGDKFSFQTFDDKKQKPYLAKHIYKSLDDAREQLIKLNSQGAGIFVTINETDGLGRKKENITKVRALFADLDGSPIEPILSAKLEPHMIVESSKGKYHAYWLVDDCPLDQFSIHQKAIAKRFDSDPSVCDLPRVMRLSGFFHCKGKPCPTTIKRHNHRSPYFLKEIEKGLCLKIEKDEKHTVKPSSSTRKPTKKTNTDNINNSNVKFTDGRRNDDLFKVACAMRGRGESKEDIRLELLSLNRSCKPPLAREEILEIVENVWNRY